jgi:hypothetical protein
MAQPQPRNRFRPQGRSAEFRIATLGGVSCWGYSPPELSLLLYPRRLADACFQRFGTQTPGTNGVRTGPLAGERSRVRHEAPRPRCPSAPCDGPLDPAPGPRYTLHRGHLHLTGTRSFSLRASAWRTYPEHLGTDGPAADSMRSVVPRSDPAEGGRCQLSRSSASGGCAQKQPLLTVSPNLWFVESRRPSCIRPATAFGESVRHRADIFEGEGLSPRQSDRAFMQVLV